MQTNTLEKVSGTMVQYVDVSVPPVWVDDSFELQLASFRNSSEVFRNLAREKALISSELRDTLIKIQMTKQQSQLLRIKADEVIKEVKSSTSLIVK